MTAGSAPVISSTANDRLALGPQIRKTGPCVVLNLVLAATAALAVLIHLSVVSAMRADVLSVFLKALSASTLLALIPLAVLWFLDRRERETPWLIAAAFLWGGCIATALVMPLNTAVFAAVDRWVALNPMVSEILGPDAATLIAAPLSAPIAEEVAKAAGVVIILLLLRHEFDGVRDGFIFGALVGVGFNWLESALYVAQGYARDGDAPYALQFGARYALFGLGGHAMFSGLFGLFLGWAAQTESAVVRVLAPIFGLGLAISAHLLNNALPLVATVVAASQGRPSMGDLPADLLEVGFGRVFLSASFFQLTIFFPFLLIVIFALWRSGVWERSVIRNELASEIGGAVTPVEYRAILQDGILRTRRVDAGHPAKSAALVNAQHELAFRKHRMRRRGVDPDIDPLVHAWRWQIERLRDAA